MLRNSPTALRLLKCALNAADDGHAGIQVLHASTTSLANVLPVSDSCYAMLTNLVPAQELGGSATMLFYQSEEGNEVSLRGISGAGQVLAVLSD